MFALRTIAAILCAIACNVYAIPTAKRTKLVTRDPQESIFNLSPCNKRTPATCEATRITEVECLASAGGIFRKGPRPEQGEVDDLNQYFCFYKMFFRGEFGNYKKFSDCYLDNHRHCKMTVSGEYTLDEINEEFPIQTREDQMLYAAKTNNPKKVAKLLKQGVDANYRDQDGDTALTLAAFNGHAEVVKTLLDNGVDVDKPSLIEGDQVTALMIASQKGDVQVVKLLVDRGAKVNLQATRYGVTALIFAIAHEHDKVAEVLMKGGADPNVVAQDGLTALMMASKQGHAKIVKLLVDSGADKNLQDTDGLTALMLASQKGHAKVVKILVDGGANKNLRDKHGQTALAIAKMKHFTRTAKILVNSGAYMDLWETPQDYSNTRKRTRVFERDEPSLDIVL